MGLSKDTETGRSRQQAADNCLQEPDLCLWPLHIFSFPSSILMLAIIPGNDALETESSAALPTQCNTHSVQHPPSATLPTQCNTHPVQHPLSATPTQCNTTHSVQHPPSATPTHPVQHPLTQCNTHSVQHYQANAALDSA